jgi:glycosyltransferase involved in cell wall biosynthesis
MKNVLHVVDKLTLGGSTLHGVTRLLSWWLPEFNKKKFNVMICTLRERNEEETYLSEKGIKVFGLGRSKFDPITILDLISIVKRENINLLHLHGYGATTFGRICSSWTSVPCIVHEHMIDKHIPIYQRLADFLLKGVTTQGIAVSKSVKNFLIKYRAIPKERIQVIYNGVPLQDFLNSQPKNISFWHTHFDIPEHYKLVTIVGRLHEIKGHRFFLEAARVVLSEYSEVKFLIVGDGELLVDLQNSSSKLGIEKDIIFTGHIDNIASLLNEANINVIASLSEGGPLSLIEAMAAGCTNVSTNVGIANEIINDGENGYIVPTADYLSLANKILLLLKDPELLDQMSTKSRISAQNFSLMQTVSDIEGCYMSLLGPENKPTAKKTKATTTEL